MPKLDDRIDERYASGQGAYNPRQLSDAENANDSYANAGINQAEAFADDPANATHPVDRVRKAESTPNSPWSTNLDSFRDTKGFSKTPNQLVGMLKKGGPAGIIGGGLIGAGSLVSFIAAPGSLLVNLKENLTLNFDQQNTSAEIRSRKILAKRLGDETTSGYCGKISFACRYEKPSNRMLDQLDKAGIKAVDKNGKVIDKQSLLTGGKRPTYYLMGVNLAEGVSEVAVKEGKPVGYNFVAAKGFEKELNTNAEFRTAMRKAHNPRWANWFDKVSTDFLNKMSISKKSSEIFDAKDAAATEKALDDLTKGETVDEAKVKGLVEEEMGRFANQSGKKIAKVSDTTLKAAAGICVASKAPGVASKVVRGYRLRNLAKVAYAFLTVGDEIKAGKATAQRVENSGNVLTKTINGRSATDGAIQYGLFKDAGAAKNSKTINKILPGSNLGWLDQFNAVANNPTIRSVCSVATSSEAQVSVSALKAFKGAAGPAGWMALAADGLFWVADKTGVTEFVVGNIVKAGMNFLNTFINWDGVLKAILGDATEGAVGERLGDIIVSGTALSMASLANAGGNAPLSKKQKIAYDQQVTIPVKLAYAEEDRITHSPFDISNPNTMLGSIATRFVPLIYANSSAATTVSALASLSFGAVSRLAIPSTHAARADEDTYSMCELDAAVKLSDVAAGPLCDVQYGVATEWLGTDPSTVVNMLFTDKQIDAEGNPIEGSELKDWIETCNNGDPTSLSDCVIDSKDKAFYALYQLDKRVADSMDSEPITGTTSSVGQDPSSTSSTTTSSIPTVGGNDQELAKKILANRNIDIVPKYKYQFEAYAKGDSSCHISSDILKLIATLGETRSIQVYSLNRDCTRVFTSATSLHEVNGGGNAVDISIVNGVAATGARAGDIKVYNDAMLILPDKKLQHGQINCRPRGSLSIPPGNKSVEIKDDCNHIHIGIFP